MSDRLQYFASHHASPKPPRDLRFMFAAIPVTWAPIIALIFWLAL